jgi:hypothetical protein
MLIEKIQGLKEGTAIPKPKATAEFKIKGWGKRRGELALTYCIPNHKGPERPLVKGITVTEFKRAYNQLLESGQFTRRWFNTNLEFCAKEGSCNFTTIGGIFQLIGLANYARPGTYVLNTAIAAVDSGQLGLEALWDQACAEALREQAAATGHRSVLDEVMDSLDEEGKASIKAAIEALKKIFGPTKANDE